MAEPDGPPSLVVVEHAEGEVDCEITTTCDGTRCACPGGRLLKGAYRACIAYLVLHLAPLCAFGPTGLNSWAGSIPLIRVEDVRDISGMRSMDKTPLAQFESDGQVSDLIIRCWSRPSTEWVQFSARFGQAKCEHGNPYCAYLNVYRAFLQGDAALRALLDAGDAHEGFAAAVLFAMEPANRDASIQALPTRVRKLVVGRLDRLGWLWSAVRSEDVFLRLAEEYALDFPVRRKNIGNMAHDLVPFTTVGRSLSFSRSAELEASVARFEHRLSGQNEAPSAFDCEIAYAFARMSTAVSSGELADTLHRISVQHCGSVRGAGSSPAGYITCCDWSVGGIVETAWHAGSPGSYILTPRQYGRMRADENGNLPPNPGDTQR